MWVAGLAALDPSPALPLERGGGAFVVGCLGWGGFVVRGWCWECCAWQTLGLLSVAEVFALAFGVWGTTMMLRSGIEDVRRDNSAKTLDPPLQRSLLPFPRGGREGSNAASPLPTPPVPEQCKNDRIQPSASIEAIAPPKTMTQLFNQSRQKWKRQKLRHQMPKAEQILWARIRRRQIANCKFRRQYSVDRFVLDFYAPEIKLAIEVDGPTHRLPGAKEYDTMRQTFIESAGISFFRVTNYQVYNQIDRILLDLERRIHFIRSGRI